MGLLLIATAGSCALDAESSFDDASNKIGVGFTLYSSPKWRGGKTAPTCSGHIKHSKIIIHHTESSRPSTHDGCLSIMRSMHDHHTRPKKDKGNRWCDIGYHYVVCNGAVYAGRKINTTGAHTAGQNAAIGIAVAGCYDSPGKCTARAVKLLAEDEKVLHTLIHELSDEYKITAAVTGHKKYNHTSCPGDLEKLLPTLSKPIQKGCGKVDPKTGCHDLCDSSESEKKAIASLKSQGVVRTCSSANAYFEPTKSITRGEFLCWLMRKQFALRGETRAPSEFPQVFTDLDVNNECSAWVQEAGRQGITAGCALGKVCPNDIATGAQIKALAKNAGYHLNVQTQQVTRAQAAMLISNLR